MNNPRYIYIPVGNKFRQILKPTNPTLRNFVIQYRGMDWSGFRTLLECEKQFPEIEAKRNFKDFTVVEK